MFSTKGLGRWMGVAVLLASPAALAQYTQYYEPAPGVQRGYVPPSGSGTTVMLGGGVMDFSSAPARAATGTTGTWGLRLGWGTRTFVGLEAAYMGSMSSLSAAGLDPDALLLGTSVEGALRLNLPLAYRDSLIEPFGFAGLGWTRFDVVREDFNLSVISNEDHILTAPVGAGLAAGVRGFMVDARFTYRFAYDEDLIGGTNLDNWIVSLNMGGEF
jgi:hypothetical protein